MTRFITGSKETDDMRDCAKNPSRRTGRIGTLGRLPSFRGIGAPPELRTTVIARGACVVLALTLLVSLAFLVSGISPASAAEPPVVTIDPTIPTTTTTAEVSGTIDTKGVETGVYIEYATDPAGPYEGNLTAVETIPAGTIGATPVSATITGLAPGTEYFFRVDAYIEGIEYYSPEPNPSAITKLPPPAAPTARTIPALILGDGTSAVIGGSVNPNNQSTAYWFEYGTTAAYSQRLPTGGGLDAGSGGVGEQLTQEITGLAPATTYHFRVVAENSAGPTMGGDVTFRTPASAAGCANEQLREENDSLNLPECRAYEQVTPQETNNGDVDHMIRGPVAAPAGGLVAYNLTQAFGSEVLGFGVFASYAASRSSDVWQSQPIQPPNAPQASFAYAGEIQAITADLSEELMLTNVDPTSREPLPGGQEPEGTQAFYLRDNTTGRYQFVTPVPAHSGPGTGGALTPDGSAAFIAVKGTLRRYETVTGQLENVAILPDGSESSTAEIAGGQTPGRHAFSDDANIVFFSDASGIVYRRDLSAQTTVPINASENSEQAAPLGEASFEGASADGSRAFFWSKQPLVDGATGTEIDLYLYDATKPAGERLTAVTSSGSLVFPGQILKMSEDGRRVYFTDRDQLVPGAPSSPNLREYLYLWDDTGSTPVLKYIAGLESTVSESSITANGRYFAFASATPGITGNETGGFTQVYLYEADGSTATVPDIACASCVAPPGVSTANAAFQPPSSRNSTWGGHLARNISATGQLFFETEGALLPEDTNGHNDVYEYANGWLHLISSGHGEYDAYFGDATPNAEDVYVYTRNALTPTHTGEGSALYDARVDGGFPVPPKRVICEESDPCQGPASMPPAPAAIGSVSFTGGGNGSQAPVKGSVGVKNMKATGSTVRLKVHVPGAGRISVSGSQVEGAHKSVLKAGTYPVTIALKPGAQKSLKKSSRKCLRVKVQVSYRPQNGRSATKTIQVTFKQPKPKRAKAGKGGR
jgi:hypothetical protein